MWRDLGSGRFLSGVLFLQKSQPQDLRFVQVGPRLFSGLWGLPEDRRQLMPVLSQKRLRVESRMGLVRALRRFFRWLAAEYGTANPMHVFPSDLVITSTLISMGPTPPRSSGEYRPTSTYTLGPWGSVWPSAHSPSSIRGNRTDQRIRKCSISLSQEFHFLPEKLPAASVRPPLRSVERPFRSLQMFVATKDCPPGRLHQGQWG